MFSYLGSKSKIVHLYPEPKHGTIIEPFCGSARYSLLYFDRDIYLYDLSDYVIDVWRYLMAASPKDILGLPLIGNNQSVNDFDLTDPEKWLIGYHLVRGKSIPRTRGTGSRGSWEKDRERIAKNLWKIKHWKITQDSYLNISNQNVTWFIDPPYQIAQRTTSDKYLHFEIDFSLLSDFVKNRKGQVIVCAGEGDNYLPFLYLTSLGSMSNAYYEEYVYHQINGERATI